MSYSKIVKKFQFVTFKLIHNKWLLYIKLKSKKILGAFVKLSVQFDFDDFLSVLLRLTSSERIHSKLQRHIQVGHVSN